MKKEFDPTNLSNFGERELELAADLLRSYARAGQCRDGVQYNNLPESWYDSGVKLAFNPNSGDVFLTNDEYQVLVNTAYGVAMWYSTPYHGIEGTLEDLAEFFAGDIMDDEHNLRLLPNWGDWATDDFSDARYLLDIINSDAAALTDPSPVIGQARTDLARLPAARE